MAFDLSADAVGLRLARITSREELILCEAVIFMNGRPAVDTTLRRAKISGRVEVDGKIDKHFADVLNGNHDLVGTVALDAKSYGALKNRWMRCRLDPAYH